MTPDQESALLASGDCASNWSRKNDARGTAYLSGRHYSALPPPPSWIKTLLHPPLLLHYTLSLSCAFTPRFSLFGSGFFLREMGHLWHRARPQRRGFRFQLCVIWSALPFCMRFICQSICNPKMSLIEPLLTPPFFFPSKRQKKRVE